jgi:hypothetical protein
MKVLRSELAGTEEQFVREHMKSLGYEFFSSGFESSVWHHPGQSTAIKLMSEPNAKAFRTYHELTKKIKCAHFLKILDVASFKLPGDAAKHGPYVQARIELLRPLNAAESREVKLLRKSIDRATFKAAEPPLNDFRSAVAYLVKQSFVYGYEDDIVDFSEAFVSNVMKRADGTLVIVDPWYSGQ